MKQRPGLKPRWTVSWMTFDNPPYFNAVAFPKLLWAVVTCVRLWRAGHHHITLSRFRGCRTYDPGIDCQPQVKLSPLKGQYHLDCVVQGFNPAPLELAAIHHKDGKHISYTVRCPMCWTYSGFSDTADKALVLWESGYRIRVEKEDGAR